MEDFSGDSIDFGDKQQGIWWQLSNFYGEVDKYDSRWLRFWL